MSIVVANLFRFGLETWLLMRSQVIVIALAGAAVSCADQPVDLANFGPIDGGSSQDVVPAPIAPPDIVELEFDRCGDVLGGSLSGYAEPNNIRSLALRENRALLVLRDQIVSLETEAGGCPIGPTLSFGVGGFLSVDAAFAVALSSNRSLVAAVDGTRLLDGNGSETQTCPGLVARFLSVGDGDMVVSAFTRSPIVLIDSSVSPCSSLEVQLTPAPYAVVAVAARQSGGFYTAELSSRVSPLVLAKYDADGTRVASSSAFASHQASKLCSVSGIVETSDGVFVVDTTCRRGILFDADSLYSVAAVVFDDVPFGAALSSDGSSVSVALERLGEDGYYVELISVGCARARTARSD